MKLTFSFLFTICVLQTGLGFPDQKVEMSNDLRKLILQAAEVIIDLQEFEGNEKSELISNLNSESSIYSEVVNKSISEALYKIELDFNKVKNQGKNPDSCKLVLENVTTLYTNFARKMRSCVKVSVWPKYSIISEHVEYFTQMGVWLSETIDSIVENCNVLNENTSKVNECLMYHKPAVEIFINGLKYVSQELKTLARQCKKEAVQKGTLCYSEAKRKVAEDLPKFKRAEEECISNL